ncbi:nucleoside hydrolase-like domain-containing protein [Paraflavisolibacter sp. H34]|uniref:nucleoside hydrolase-like domain-containing protein n=1 Tax=Huijunlia imazamoxiresistens TaxID=3127457 RepID=UPI003017971D
MNKLILLSAFLCGFLSLSAQKPIPVKPRILISTDIGGTDPDDNQSMIHFLMYSEKFNTEGLISSPSYGTGSKEEILRMIDLYEKDLPRLQKRQKGLATPAYLRSITKQGKQGHAPYSGISTATEGSDWIIQCARKKSSQPLWVLVWGGLEDVAQALHDAPEIKTKIKIYWIGGPNKKWSANSYAYIVEHFPDLWFIEDNSSYYGFFSNNGMPDSVKTTNYYDRHIQGAGHMGKAFKNYYGGNVKAGDTPSLLYMMDGDPNNPMKESWGGSFEKFDHSPRILFHRNTTLADTVTVCSVLEFHFQGPKINIPADSACFTLSVKAGIGEQKWDGYYRGDGDYVVRYIPKQSETLSYTVTSPIAGFRKQSGQLVVDNLWPGKKRETDYPLGPHWYTDRSDPKLYDGKIQGGITVKKWRNEVLQDWAKRWAWLGAGAAK